MSYRLSSLLSPDVLLFYGICCYSCCSSENSFFQVLLCPSSLGHVGARPESDLCWRQAVVLGGHAPLPVRDYTVYIALFSPFQGLSCTTLSVPCPVSGEDGQSQILPSSRVSLWILWEGRHGLLWCLLSFPLTAAVSFSVLA